MRSTAALVLALVGSAACAEPQGEIVTCSQTWTCGDDVVGDNSQSRLAANLGHVFCTKPGTDALGSTAGNDERSADIAAYRLGFAEDCNGVNIACLNPAENGEFATCAATCSVGAPCDPENTLRVRLN